MTTAAKRRPAKAKPNHLTRQTNADWNACVRSEKTGWKGRGDARAFAWARWKAERLGLTIPADATATLGGAGDSVVFVARTPIPGWTETLRGPRGGFKGSVWHPPSHHDVELVTIQLPAHCRPIAYADEWHTAHQAGCDPETRWHWGTYRKGPVYDGPPESDEHYEARMEAEHAARQGFRDNLAA